MPKFTVNVLYHKAFDKNISVYAKDEQEAEEKAVDIVNQWDGVVDAEAGDVMQD